MATHDNAPPLPDWQLPPRSKCCGEWTSSLVCPVCANYVQPGSHIELGVN